MMVAAALVALSLLAVPAGECMTAGDAQAIIDAAPDGPTATADDLKTKLRFGAPQFTLVDFSGSCIDAGEIDVTNRQGVWIRGVNGPATVWHVTDSTATIITNPTAHTVTVIGGSARVETAQLDTLAVVDAEIYAGKVFGRVASFKSSTGFFRGSDVDLLILDGDPTPAIRGVTYRVLIDTSG